MSPDRRNQECVVLCHVMHALILCAKCDNWASFWYKGFEQIALVGTNDGQQWGDMMFPWSWDHFDFVL